MSQVVSLVSGRAYGLAVVCRVWRIARSGVYRFRARCPRNRGRYKREHWLWRAVDQTGIVLDVLIQISA